MEVPLSFWDIIFIWLQTRYPILQEAQKISYLPKPLGSALWNK